MKMIKIGRERVDASEIRCYWPDERGSQSIIDITFKDRGVGNYIVFDNSAERDEALNKLDTVLGVLGVHRDDEL